MSVDLKAAVITASEKWKAAFNAGDPAGCAACYEVDAVMVAKPFGSFQGREEIQSFWQNIIKDGFNSVEYLGPEMTVVDESSVLLTSGWKMNKAQGIITGELWVLQDDGTMLLREDHFEAQG